MLGVVVVFYHVAMIFLSVTPLVIVLNCFIHDLILITIRYVARDAYGCRGPQYLPIIDISWARGAY